jgi:2,3-bisphosphoglycerate-independent phosphoglycerate mutase
MIKTKTLLLCILDGFGIDVTSGLNKDGKPVAGYKGHSLNSAIAQANTPELDKLFSQNPWSLLQASAESVGLPVGQMGNSEVGHITIGSGRVVAQDLPKINEVINGKKLTQQPALAKFIAQFDHNKTVHIIGLVSDGGVHSHIKHIIELVLILQELDIKTSLHMVTDGRDTSPTSAINFLQQLSEAGIMVATISGRYYSMDRDKRWERTEASYRAIALAQGEKYSSAVDAIKASYAKEITDEFIVPMINSGYKGIQKGDSVIFANFRADRVRQLLAAIANPNFAEFKIQDLGLSKVLGMVPYSDELDKYVDTIFPKQNIQHTLGEVISQVGLTQLRAAETEKYAHVTFFLNGGREIEFSGEQRILVPSPKIATYDLQPEMSAYQLTDQVINAIKKKHFDFICLNFANPDMVGHTGNMQAAIKAVESVDACLGELISALDEISGEMLLTADHGNCESMFDQHTGNSLTSHTLNPVPLLYYGKRNIEIASGELADIAPTILELMGISKPIEMTGKSLMHQRVNTNG